jgi:hypothetical protein
MSTDTNRPMNKDEKLENDLSRVDVTGDLQSSHSRNDNRKGHRTSRDLRTTNSTRSSF